MKGIVFSEFIEFVEDRFSPEIADDIIEASDLSTGGAYTSVGTYDHKELLQLVSNLSEITHTPVQELVCAYGRHLFGRLSITYPQFIAKTESTFTFLQHVDDHIHVEVYKLYPEAELPRFEYEFPRSDQMVMIYSSTRPLADLAEGLIQSCIEYFGEDITVEREDLFSEEGTMAKFTLTEHS